MQLDLRVCHCKIWVGRFCSNFSLIKNCLFSKDFHSYSGKATNSGYCMLYKKSITLFLVNHSIALLWLELLSTPKYAANMPSCNTSAQSLISVPQKKTNLFDFLRDNKTDLLCDSTSLFELGKYVHCSVKPLTRVNWIWVVLEAQ